MRCAVVGHVEWIQSVLVDRVPGRGEIAHAVADWEEPGGGGAVAAAQLAKIAGGCDFFTALGEDDIGHRSAVRLAELDVTVHAEWAGSTRRGFVMVDANGERTIITVGPKLRPRTLPPMNGYDAVFFVAGEPEALRAARAARFLSATPREAENLKGVHLDLLVGSGLDPAERYEGGLDVDTVVATEGALGGVVNGRRYPAVAPRGPIADTYGAGDSFAAALTFALATAMPLDEALAYAARAGASVVTGKGPFAGQLDAKSG